MRKLLVTLIALVGLGATGLAFADGLGTGISTAQSPHNFADNWCGGSAAGGGVDCSTLASPIVEIDGAGTGWNGREEICRVCHVPHDHNRTTTSYWTAGLLWNHAAPVTADWTPYDSGSMDAVVGDPSGPSLLCLGCHDGSTGLDTFDKYAGGSVFIATYNTAYQVPATGTAGDLSGSHPISMSYYDDGNMNDAASTAMGTSGFIEDVLFGTPGTSTVECSSCHDVHDQNGLIGTHLLRVANSVADGGTASGLCLTCHDK